MGPVVGSGQECVRRLTAPEDSPLSSAGLDAERALFLAASAGRESDGQGGEAALRAVVDELLSRQISEDDPTRLRELLGLASD
jgi:hypothetical protein